MNPNRVVLPHSLLWNGFVWDCSEITMTIFEQLAMARQCGTSRDQVAPSREPVKAPDFTWSRHYDRK
jgi:hypothetical protein